MLKPFICLGLSLLTTLGCKSHKDRAQATAAAACGKSPWRLTVITGWQEFTTPTTRQMHVGASCGYNYPLHRDLLFQITSWLLHFKRSNISKIERPSHTNTPTNAAFPACLPAWSSAVSSQQARLYFTLSMKPSPLAERSSSHLCKLRGRRKRFVPITMPRYLHLTAHKGCHLQMKMCFYSNYHAGNTEARNPFDMIYLGVVFAPGCCG